MKKTAASYGKIKGKVYVDLPFDDFAKLIKIICRETTNVKPTPSKKDLQALFKQADEDRSGTVDL